jgi:hypothetical protein
MNNHKKQALALMLGFTLFGGMVNTVLGMEKKYETISVGGTTLKIGPEDMPRLKDMLTRIPESILGAGLKILKYCGETYSGPKDIDCHAVFDDIILPLMLKVKKGELTAEMIDKEIRLLKEQVDRWKYPAGREDAMMGLWISIAEFEYLLKTVKTLKK